MTVKLDLLSLPIVEKSGEPTPYFEDVFNQLIEAMGGEGNSPIDDFNLVDLSEKPKVNHLKKEVQDLRQLLTLNPSLRPKINANTSAIDDLNNLVVSLISRCGRLESIISRIGLKTAEIPTGGTTFNTTGNQIVTCNNTATATVVLNTSPVDGEEVIVSRRDALINFTGTINGSTTISLISQYDTIHLTYTIAAGEWMIT